MRQYCQATRKPRMYVPKGIIQSRLNYFMREKYPVLRQVVNNEALNTYYSSIDFIDLLDHVFNNNDGVDGIRIYFASYGPDGSASVPAGYGEKLTLIFGPTINTADEVYTDTGDYYIILPGVAFNPSTPMDRNLASSWVSNYQNIKLPRLQPTVNGPDTDTRSLYYPKDLIYPLKDEILCQSAKGIKAYFCAHTDQELRYPKILNINFTLTRITEDGEEEDFFIEDSDGWDTRPIRLSFEDVGSSKMDFKMDTGNPCPPATCAGEDLP